MSGLVLVAYGLTLATWVSSSDSSTGFLDLSYGDPPYGFKDTAWAEVIALAYFNGGAWVLLAGVALLVGVALLTRVPIVMLGAQAVAAPRCCVEPGGTGHLGTHRPTDGCPSADHRLRDRDGSDTHTDRVPTCRSADNSLLTGVLGAIVLGAGIIALAQGDTGAAFRGRCCPDRDDGGVPDVGDRLLPELSVTVHPGRGPMGTTRAIIGLVLGAIAVFSIMLIWGYANLHQNTG